MSDDTNLDVSRRIQEKFEFYFLGLTFAILGLSIQTSKFSAHPIPDALELLGWISLFVSGTAGLSRMRWAPFLYKVKHEIIKREQYRDEAKRRESNGETSGAFVADVSQGVKEVEDQLGNLETKNNIKYWLHVYGFTVGRLFLMGARGYQPVARFVSCIVK